MTLPVVFTANGQAGYNLTKSLRFRSSASAYLNRTQGTSTNQSIGTWSFWFKRGTLGTAQRLFEGYTASSDTGNGAIEFGADNCLYVGGWSTNWRITTQVFRDPSAWYHMVVTIDTTQATANNRIKVYVNGTEITAFSTTNNPTQNSTFGLNNNSSVLQIGRRRNAANNDQFFDGYLAEVNFIDGQALTPSSFGETSTTTGVWIPKKYTGTYGTNGFYLPFTDTTSTSTLGTDFSGNSNTWTVNNISLTSGSTYDSMTDVPTLTSATTANYCTLNAALQAGGYTLNDGNLNWARTGATGGPNDRSQFGTIGVTSGKWYWEFTAGTVNSNSIPAFGIAIGSASTQSWGGSQTGVYIYESDGLKYLSGTGSSYGATFTTGDIIGVAFDADAGTLTFYKNNTSQGQAASGLTAGPYFPAVTRTVGGGGSNGTEIANFGQRPFAYTPPTGFVRLNTFNLTTPTIGATAATTANKYFDAITRNGFGTSGGSVATNFQADLIWEKPRNITQSHYLVDSVRGITSGTAPFLSSNSTSQEQNANWYNAPTPTSISFNSNDWGTSTTLVDWIWRAGGTPAVTNTAGSITSTVSANTTAGFSIVTYTGTGANATVGHGLGVAPSMIIARGRSAGTAGFNWRVYHGSLAATAYLEINTTSGQQTDATVWNSTAPTSSVFSLGSSGNVNGSTQTFVAYCFAPIAGYSAFGSYTGNGATDGPFVYLGFRPRFVLVKRTDSTGNWSITDTAINPYNNTTGALRPNTADSESTVGTVYVQPLSNGFKITNNNTDTNASSGTYIYACFAENPFKYANAR